MSKESDAFNKMLHDKTFGPFWESGVNMEIAHNDQERQLKEAVVEAAIRDREAETRREDDATYAVGFDRMIQARRELRQAVTDLIEFREYLGEP